MELPKKRLGDILIDCNLITLEQLKEALAFQKEKGLKLGAALTTMGLVTEDDIIWALGNQLNISFVHLNPDIVDRAVLEWVTPEFCREYKVLPLYCTGNQLSIVMVDPLDGQAIESLAQKSGKDISVSICTQLDFTTTYNHLFGPIDTEERVREAAAPEKATLDKSVPKGLEAPEKIVNYILGQAIINNVSKIHFEPADKGVQIRYRVHSSLVKKLEIPQRTHQEVITKLKLLCQIPAASAPGQQVGHFRVTVSGRVVNIQALFYPTVNGEMVILKLSDTASHTTEMMHLGQNRVLEGVVQFLHANHGVLYVTGPRESGRTTSNYYFLSTYKAEQHKIVTIENPVQVSLPNMTQIPLGQGGVNGFAEGLNVALRLDADLIYLDELADGSVVEGVAFAALGGKTLLTSFMAYDAPSSVVRLLSMTKDPVIVAASLCGFLSQRLVRTLCPACSETYAPTPEEVATLEAPPEKLVRAKGCDACHQTGYAGRTLVAEFLPQHPTLRQMIINREGYQEIAQYARKQGIPSISQQVLEMVAAGTTSLDEYLRLF